MGIIAVKNKNCEFIKFCRVPEFQHLELYSGTNVVRSVSRHIHLFFSLGVGEGGIRTHVFKGATHYITPGSIVVVNIGEVHSGGATDTRGYSSRSIRIDMDFLRWLISLITGREQETVFFSQPVIHDRTLYQQILYLHTVLDQPVSKLEKECRLLDTLSRLIARHACERPEYAALGNECTPVRRVCNYLNESFAENVSLERLASIADLSPFHLARVFTKEIGVPPHIYQTQIRLRRALDLLALGKPISQVAVETGFYDQSHFTRAFKAKFGITPGQYLIR